MNQTIAVFFLLLSIMSCTPEKPIESTMAKEPFADKKIGEVIDTLVDVGGYALHFNIVKGTGIPILFESGGGNDGSVWKDLLPALSDSLGATLITYDRAGFGQSGIDTNRITILNEVKDLEVALQKLGYAQSTFSVSHSLGGSYAILYASRNEKKMKGAVFIDITLPCFYNEEKTKEAIAQMAAYGIENIRAAQIGFYYIFSNYENTNALMRKTVYPANIPSTVIGADEPPSMVKTAADIAQWKACQKAFGTWPAHHYVLAENTSHNVFKDRPALVIEEIVKRYRAVGEK